MLVWESFSSVATAFVERVDGREGAAAPSSLPNDLQNVWARALPAPNDDGWLEPGHVQFTSFTYMKASVTALCQATIIGRPDWS